MNILYIGFSQGFDNADKYYMIPQKLLNGFIRNGHNVYIFNDRDYARSTNIFNSSKLGIGKLNHKILDVCPDFHPDLIVLGHCKHVSNETLLTIRENLSGVKIIYCNVDPLHSEKNIKDIKDRSGVVDGIFITTAGNELKQFSHQKTFVTFMPNPIDSSIETGKAFDFHNAKYDLFFAGNILRHQHDQRHDELLNIQKQLPELNLGFFGAGVGTDTIYGYDFIENLKRSKIGLCLNKTSDYYLYASDRMAQYLGHGLLVFIDRGSQFMDLFNEDEIAFYNDSNELIEKLRYFSSHDSERRKMAEKSWTKAHRLFDCKKVTQYMIERTFDLPISQNYGWPTNVY